MKTMNAKIMMIQLKLICLSLITFVISDVTANFDVWKKVMVGTQFIEADTKPVIIKIKSTVVCGTKCSMEPFCTSWCQEKEECTLTSIVVSPNYVGSSSNSTACYTKKRRDIVVGATTYSTKIWCSDCLSELAADGIFLHGFGPRFDAEPFNRPSWILFDLKKPATIFEIRLITHVFYCQEFKLFIGNILVTDEDFSSYSRIDSLVDPCVEGADEFHFKPLTPMQGQYVLVFRETRGFSLDHVEVDGEFLF